MILRVAHLFHEIFLVHAIHGESLPRSRLNRWKKKNSQDEESNGHLLSLSLSHQLVLPRTFSLTIFLLFPATRFPSAARFSWSSSFYVPPSRSPNCPSLFRSRRSTFSLSLSWFHSHLLTSPRGESFSLHVQSLTFRRAVDRQP